VKADWISVAEARDIVITAVAPLDSEVCAIGNAVGRVLAEKVISPIDLPRWTNSGMDGFALRAADVVGASKETPVTLPVVDDVAAGAFPRGPLPSGTAARVMTGAPVPEGADSVIRVEDTDAGLRLGEADATVRIHDARDSGRNVRRQGEEITRGGVALEANTPLGPAAIGVSASLGYAEIRVFRRPRVALLTSGDELVEVAEFEQVLAGGKIVSSNSYSLAAALIEVGCDVRYLGIAPDDPAALLATLRDAHSCDAIVTSAGISVGEHDHLKRVLLDLGADVLFWRVRMRPGSPFAFGRVHAMGGIPWFGLPGNPVSSLVTFELFVRPSLLRMGGHRRLFRRTVPATFLDPFDPPPGLAHFLRVRLESLADGQWGARLTGAQGSNLLSSVAAADGLLVVGEEHTGPTTGRRLPVILLTGGLATETAGF
jgi:molybdopterin molybdotransferase